MPSIGTEVSKEPWSAHALIPVGRVFYLIKNINQSLPCVRRLNELMKLSEIRGYARPVGWEGIGHRRLRPKSFLQASIPIVATLHSVLILRSFRPVTHYSDRCVICSVCREMWISLPLYSNVPLHTTRSTQRVRYASSLKIGWRANFLKSIFPQQCKMASQMFPWVSLLAYFVEYGGKLL